MTATGQDLMAADTIRWDDVPSCMAGDRWGTWFWTAMNTTSGTDVNKAYGFQALELTDNHAMMRWTPSREVFTHLPDAGDFVWGGAVGAALHCGTMIGAVVVLADNEFPMTLQEDHRFFRPVAFGETYLVTGTPDRRTRNALWTTTTIVAESSGRTAANSTSVNQLIEQNAS
jgi:acyl-coenzyme A thioesterase PaaI-like protein